MDQESTPAQSAEGQAPEDTGPVPTQATPTEPLKGDRSFGEDYVKQLRKENAGSRSELNALKSELQALRDRDKTDTERLTDKLTKTEQRAIEAESQLLRFEIAAARGLDLSVVNAIRGDTREELEANADVLAQQLSRLNEAARV